MDINQFIVNNKINNFINSKKYKKYKLMYHITTLENAKSILKNGFDVSKAYAMAFGKGINLTDDINELKHYYNKKTRNAIILCIVRYNKLKYNESTYTKEYYEKYGFSKPTHMNVPKGYDGFYNSDIFVMKSKKYVYPLCTLNINLT
jgi:hypothetical protein